MRIRPFDSLAARKMLVACAVCISAGLALSFPAPAAADTPDPLEPMNRKIFWFNEQFDEYLARPVALGYKWVLPLPARRSVGNFFINALSPVYFVSDIIQFKFGQAGTHLGRFLINTTIGVGGLFDVAESEFGLEHHLEDIGSAAGYWGVGEGFYLVIPFLGPTNARDGVGRICNAFLNPLNYASMVMENGEYVSYGLYALDTIQSRARYDEGIETTRETSLDYYVFMRSTYHQLRQNVIYDDNPPDDETPEYEEEETPAEAPADTPAETDLPESR